MKNLLWITVFLSTLSLSFAQQDINLNLEVGETYKMRQETVSTTKQKVNGFSQDVTTTITQDTDFKVMSLKENIYKLEVTPTTSSTEQKSAMGNMFMDSEGPQSDPLNVIMKNLTGTPLLMTITKSGDILSLDASKMREGIMNNVNLPEMQKLQVEAEMLKNLTDEVFTDSYQALFNIYPKEKVKKEDTWNSVFKTSTFFTIESTATNRLIAYDDHSYTIKSEADMATEPGAKLEILGMKGVADIKGHMSSTYILDRSTGWIKSMQQEQKLSGSIEMPANDMSPQAVKIVMDVINVTTID
ncbi:DUF6263 family protein [Nonlabens xiamenensis]|uniref:DUF6263 family protein n=1 Tax=Nonlabens xiamenensis TaxID=2341043 RepID=UPI000F60FB1E|nr:DUF6263 family protein [Nonlabens xiamenensis]